MTRFRSAHAPGFSRGEQVNNLVPADHIEAIVGAERRPSRHIARAVSAEQTVYILHPYSCLLLHQQLTDCAYSRALDRGISLPTWEGREDRPIYVVIGADGRLVPTRGMENPSHGRYPAWHHERRCHNCAAVEESMAVREGQPIAPVDFSIDERCPECDRRLTHQWVGPVMQTEFYTQYSGGWCSQHGAVEIDWEWS